MGKDLKPVHLIHLLLYSPTATEKKPVPILGRTRLMKMIFIFEKELSHLFQNENKPLDFNFEAYNFGPYSKKVYEAIDFLETREIIRLFPVSPPNSVDKDEMELDRRLMEEEAEVLGLQNEEIFISEGFELTENGKKIMTNHNIWFSWAKLTDDRKKILEKFKTKMVNTTLKDILKYVYTKYPKYAEKSLIYHTLFSEGVFK
ncbi:MAG: Panacea domain-containing protein [Acidobacteria bacterium]|jgi:uncharacterized phage-associated protein|nr:Panacea domain-containing protein [Acidobacteriota bacterium]